MFDQPANHYLAQINVATAKFDMDDPRMQGFTGRTQAVNAVAERSPGFVWRLQGEAGDALDIRASADPRFLVNISVWETPEALEHFVWNTAHAKVYQDKAKWFPKSDDAYMAFWWVPVGHLPTVEEGMARLEGLRANGPTREAFGWESLPSVVLWMEKRCG